MLQAALQHGALSLLDAILHFGSYGVYRHWLEKGPWLSLRNLVQFQHSASPMSPSRFVRPTLCAQVSYGGIFEFRRWMPAYGILGWPLWIFGEIWVWWQSRPKWLEVNDIVTNLTALKITLGASESASVLGLGI
jgi:hypothetical protein